MTRFLHSPDGVFILLIRRGRLFDAGTIAELLEHAGQPNLTDAFLGLVARLERGEGARAS